ncbi:GlsB/YeaQ/YmgE family stress response membrane protein [Nesterenkonia halophila]|uniref:GlsB/YeaQ/YmgE family stress response membrane protein n=1 Tax=Nesterenkonia halophila TaxID=302044 RepID=UPI001290CD00|nr:GlsB/YeaQ/YmgE family stress response membrane protein [Nesterenkonia halophila]
MAIIGWIIVGLVAGVLARLIMPGKQGGGWLSAILLGVVGALLGGLLFGLFGGKGMGAVMSDPWSLGSLIIAVIGALVFSFVWRLVAKR